MRPTSRVCLHLRWLNLPGALLVALLQRTPALQVAVFTGERLAAAPLGAVLRSTLTATAALGTVHSLAGATQFVTSSNPVTGTVGTAITPVTFTITGAPVAPGSFKIVSGRLPPGLGITGLDPNTLIVNTSIGTITGTPLTAGKTSLLVRAYQLPDAQGDSLPALFGYQINFNITSDTVVAPTITTQPVAQTMASGSTVVFAVVAGGTPAPTYQWSKDNVALTGATTAMLVLKGATAANAGTYTCAVSNTGGTVTSNAARLDVVATADAGRLINLSVRTGAGTGDQTLIAGFAVGGAGTGGAKPLLLRGIGPSLAQFGLSGVVADPLVEVFQQTAMIATNDNWGGDAAVAARAAQVGAFPLDPSSFDAALALSPVPGAYSMQVLGSGGGTGLALAEIYDATPAGTFTAATPRLVNLSARSQVGVGTNLLIAGFVIGGTTAKTVLIRATGPALAAFGVTGTLADPKLQLFTGTTMLRENDNWGGDAQLAAVGGGVGAFPISDSTSKDAALLVTLAPGSYTAQVSGADGGTGVALVEVYEVP